MIIGGPFAPMTGSYGKYKTTSEGEESSVFLNDMIDFIHNQKSQDAILAELDRNFKGGSVYSLVTTLLGWCFRA